MKQKIQVVIRHQVITFASELLIELETQVKVIMTSLSRPFCCYRKWPMTHSARTHLSVWQKPILNHKNLIWKGGRKDVSIGPGVYISLCICHNNRLIIWCKDKTFSPPEDNSPPYSMKGLWETQCSREKCSPVAPSSTQLSMAEELNPWIATIYH